MNGNGRPTLWIFAGPNGVGKTTYAFKNIRTVTDTVNFVNLDEIARGLSPFDVDAVRIRAARIALDMQQDFMRRGESFSIETTLAGRVYLNLVRQARETGFHVHLNYFLVPNAEICIARVAERVGRGGHFVPDDDVRRRFARSIAMFPAYARLADTWRAFDSRRRPPSPMAFGRDGGRSIGKNGWRKHAEVRVGIMPAAFREGLASLPLLP